MFFVFNIAFNYFQAKRNGVTPVDFLQIGNGNSNGKNNKVTNNFFSVINGSVAKFKKKDDARFSAILTNSISVLRIRAIIWPFKRYIPNVLLVINKIVGSKQRNYLIIFKLGLHAFLILAISIKFLLFGFGKRKSLRYYC
ncbi:hypothetical protein GGTG_11553 [Gaeumannomyces tritici R3-111a-1]|uniref:Uncharacterized protein n=1 Tax=Gaeumannomyces tritici (strain R3-111a-1) TaxID=644352 RepID=J3PDI0_GAET3|nr:hypothetical protein GGTG_11553 [Gaeumannomyces tritici R3-111a-1]EJT70530.1 hypothetical protein GGTG_11553 [Gaeumannomyces tritici R3-111a-1]